MMPVRFLAAAVREMAEAAQWYQERTPGMGEAFLEQAKATAEFVAAFPESGEELPKGYRRKLLRRFPYAIVYTIDPGELVVHAVAHLSRRPGYWLRRDR